MKKKLTLLIILFSFTIGYSQNTEISELISSSLNNSNLDLRLNRLATSSKYFKIGERFRLSVTFEINDIGRLVNISVRGPLPAIEQTVTNELKNIVIPKDLLKKAGSSITDLKFALPIHFQVSSESDILKSREKKKRRVQREKEKALKKKN